MVDKFCRRVANPAERGVEVTFAQKNTKYYNVNKLKRILTKYGFENVSFILPKEYSLYQTIPFYFKEKVR
jgi:hypothetical protein